MRHGQSEFNVVYGETRRDPGIRDPKLTPLGLRQAHHTATALADAPVKRIICSPYWRALQTAEIVAAEFG
ncbi:MAG: histidine phosphatase family protein, partial [Alphaproteobacteria bacterium]